MMKEQNELNKFWEDTEKAIRSMPKKPTMVIENPRLVGVRLNQELIDGLEKQCVKPTNIDGNWFLGTPIFKEERARVPQYIIEGTPRMVYSNSDRGEVLKALDILYEEAKIEADVVKEHVITYAERNEHNEGIKPYYEAVKEALTTMVSQEEHYKLQIEDSKLLNQNAELFQENKKLKRIIKIIEDKNVDLGYLKGCLKINIRDIDALRSYNHYHSGNELTEEEFDILKEIKTNG